MGSHRRIVMFLRCFDQGGSIRGSKSESKSDSLKEVPNDDKFNLIGCSLNHVASVIGRSFLGIRYRMRNTFTDNGLNFGPPDGATCVSINMNIPCYWYIYSDFITKNPQKTQFEHTAINQPWLSLDEVWDLQLLFHNHAVSASPAIVVCPILVSNLKCRWRFDSATSISLPSSNLRSLHHRSIVGYTKSRVDAGLGYMILSSFEDFLHENYLENRVGLEVG